MDILILWWGFLPSKEGRRDKTQQQQAVQSIAVARWVKSINSPLVGFQVWSGSVNRSCLVEWSLDSGATCL